MTSDLWLAIHLHPPSFLMTSLAISTHFARFDFPVFPGVFDVRELCLAGVRFFFIGILGFCFHSGLNVLFSKLIN
jgi:hypothetical protein